MKIENRLILGQPGSVAKFRSFTESVFRLEYVPSYVKTVHVLTNKRDGRKFYCYVDTYDNEQIEEQEMMFMYQLLHNTEEFSIEKIDLTR